MAADFRKQSRRKLLKYFNALDDARFVDHCLELIYRGVDIGALVSDSEIVFVEAIDNGLDEHIRNHTGLIYLAANPVYQSNIFKIGKTRKSGIERMDTLKTAGVLGSFVLAGSWPSRDLDRTEVRCHQALADCRIDGEFFHVDYHSAAAAITRVLGEEDKTFMTLQELAIGH
jgi:hypothetical protein